MENWGPFYQIAIVIFFAGGAVAALHNVSREVQQLKATMQKLDRREVHHHQQSLIVLTMLASYHNPENHHLTAAIEKLGSNNYQEE